MGKGEHHRTVGPEGGVGSISFGSVGVGVQSEEREFAAERSYRSGGKRVNGNVSIK